MDYKFVKKNWSMKYYTTHMVHMVQLLLDPDLREAEAGVINDPIRQTHSNNQYRYFLLKICVILQVLRSSDGCVKIIVTNGVGRVDQKLGNSFTHTVLN